MCVRVHVRMCGDGVKINQSVSPDCQLDDEVALKPQLLLSGNSAKGFSGYTSSDSLQNIPSTAL